MLRYAFVDVKKQRLAKLNEIVKKGEPACFSQLPLVESLQSLISIALPSGSVVPPIDSVYEFEDVLNAYDKIMSERTRGKVVIHVP